MSKELTVDVWGHSELEPKYLEKPAVPYEVNAPTGDAGAIYTRYLNRATTCIHRTTISEADGRQTVVCDVAYGAWADRATLVYSEPASFPKKVNFAEA